MSQKLKCPACGKARLLPEPIVEQTVTCLACGMRIHVAAETVHQGLPASDGSDDINAGQLSGGTIPAAGQSQSWVAGTSGAAVLVLVGMLTLVLAALWVADIRRTSSRAGNRQTAVQLKVRADRLLAAGKLEEVRDAYRCLGDFIAPKGAEPEFRALGAEANARQLSLSNEIARRLLAENRKVALWRLVLPISLHPPGPSIRSSHQTPLSSSQPSLPGLSSLSGKLAVTPDIVRIPATRPFTPTDAETDPSRPPVRPAKNTSRELTDRNIGDSITAGMNWMIGQFDADRHELQLQIGDRDPMHGGMDALCVYALMQCGEAISDPRLSIHGPFMKGCIDVMKQFPNEEPSFHLCPRHPGHRARALQPPGRSGGPSGGCEVADRGGPRRGLHLYEGRQSWPATAGRGCRCRGTTPTRSTACWVSGRVRKPRSRCPPLTGRRSKITGSSCQAKNGQWAYGGGRAESGTLSMTSAGVASLFVTHDWLDAAAVRSQRRARSVFAGRSSEDWTGSSRETTRSTLTADGGDTRLYGVERVGLASGFKYFGSHDWYRELAAASCDAQSPDGSWNNGNPVDTAYCLLFLSRGRHPILMNKLRFDGYWANRPRDLANLARYTSHQLERTVNWQVVPLSHPWTDWTDSPIVYLASHQRRESASRRC